MTCTIRKMILTRKNGTGQMVKECSRISIEPVLEEGFRKRVEMSEGRERRNPLKQWTVMKLTP